MPLTISVDVLFAAKSGGGFKVLLLRRAKSDSYGGMLKPIGGKAEVGETTRQTVLRETREEGGAWLAEQLESDKMLFMLRLSQRRTDTRQVTNLLYVLDLTVEEVSERLVMEEGVSFEWLDLAQAAVLQDGSDMKAGVPDGINASFPDTKVAAIRAHTVLGDPDLLALLHV
jgi:8-oxo-dGTP pyrophosphatase MutT (NUDIX family)